MRCYIALLTKDRADRYCITLPDFPGAQTWCDVLSEASAAAARLLAGEIETRRASSRPIPRPTAAELLLRRALCTKAIPIVVTPPEPVAGRISVDVDLPAGLVARVDERAREHGVDRSDLIAKVVRLALWETSRAARRALAGN